MCMTKDGLQITFARHARHFKSALSEYLYGSAMLSYIYAKINCFRMKIYISAIYGLQLFRFQALDT